MQLTFFQGASLEDPHKLFNAGLESKAMRYIKFREGDAINEAALRDLIRAAVAYNLADPVENSILFFQSLRKAKVPGELHVFPHGRHGVGLAPDDPALSQWPRLCAQWMKGLGVDR